MIRKVIYAGEAVKTLLTRPESDEKDVTRIVRDIIMDVRARGDEALYDYSERFDGARPDSLVVTKDEIDEAYQSCDKALLDTMRLAAKNIASFHEKQVRQGFVDASEAGIVRGQRVIPLEKVGIYVPGGTARYPSTVLMNALPAKIAGVDEIVMTTPCGKDGRVPAAILAAARIAGVTKIIKSGGAQAVAALAFGTKSVPKVDKVVGPGNIFVATAKRLVYGTIDIDMIAGPSEILVVADKNSNPAFVASDLLSQAEHDKLASAWLVTDSEALADAVSEEIEKQLPLLLRADIARTSIDTNGRVIVVEDIAHGAVVANEIAPEHLELCVDNPFEILPLIRNAGSVFLGRMTPESLGDYLAGPNHTLPTSGTAKFSSPLSVDDFVKKSSFIYYSADALKKVHEDVERFALSEGLTAHARAAAIRFEEE